MTHPECPEHGVGGSARAQTKAASVVKCGFTTSGRKRQKFECRFELHNGTTGRHRFTEPIPRLVTEAPLCDHCGQPLEEWQGEQVFRHYYFLAEPIADALVDLANGKSYRQTSADFHARIDRVANPLEPRRLARRARIEAEAQANPDKARYLAGKRPYRRRSNESNLAEWLVEALAEIVWTALAPQEWPAGGIVAVDAVKLNLLGKHKYKRRRGRTDEEVLLDLVQGIPDNDEDEIEVDESGYEVAPEDVIGISTPPVENVEHSLEDMLDPDDDEEAAALSLGSPPSLSVIQGGPASVPGTQGGVPCWQVLAAYGYEPTPLGEFPRDEITGKGHVARDGVNPVAQFR